MSGRDPEDFLSKPEKKGAGGKQKVVKAGSSHNGSLLHAWICQEASNRGETLRAAAKKIGKTYGYFYQLNTGVRDVESVSNEFVISCARYLGIPPIVVKLAAGKIAI